MKISLVTLLLLTMLTGSCSTAWLGIKDDDEREQATQLYDKLSSIMEMDNLSTDEITDPAKRTIVRYRVNGQYGNKIYTIILKVTPLVGRQKSILYTVEVTIINIDDDGKRTSVEKAEVKGYSKNRVLSRIETLLLR